jgi:hypothetical protein
MEFPLRQYSKGRIDRAGEELVRDQATNETFAVINNWESCHGYPLQAVTMTLQNRAKIRPRFRLTRFFFKSGPITFNSSQDFLDKNAASPHWTNGFKG